MKILLLCNRIPYPLTDGGAIAIHNMIKGLKEAGNRVDVFSLNTLKHFVEPTKIPSFFNENGSLIYVNVDTSIKPLDAFLNLFGNKSYNIERFFQSVVMERLKKLLLTSQYDLIQIEGLFMLPYLDTIRKFTKAKVSYRAHNIESQIWSRLAASASGIKKWYLELLSKRLMEFESKVPGKVDVIIPITNDDAQFFKTYFRDVKIFVSPAGVDLDNFKNIDVKPIAKSFFHLGALNWLPNQEAVSWLTKSIFQKLISKRSDFSIYIAGKHTPSRFFDYQNSNLFVLGEVDDAIKFMCQHEVMLVPLLSGSGMRLKIIEGMALSKAIISTSVGAEGINYTPNKNILIANTEEEFVSAIEYLLDQPQRITELGSAAKKLIHEEYDNSTIVKRLSAYYKEELICLG
jgi:glycosyltransferase involved in cell wall biosynthesis